MIICEEDLVRRLNLVLIFMSVILAGCTMQVSVSSGPIGGGSGAAPRSDSFQLKGDNFGWIEVAVINENVQCPDAGMEEKESPCPPPQCLLEVRLNKEPLSMQQMSAFGEEPPFRVDAGFRFPAPPGAHDVSMAFLCSSDPDSAAKSIGGQVHATSTIEVRKQTVTSLEFDGKSIIFLGFSEDSASGIKDFSKENNVPEEKFRERSL